MAEPRHLVVFLREPRLGRVKSRLAAGIGDLAALRFYREVSSIVLHRVGRDRRWRTHLALVPDGAAARKLPWSLPVARRPQGSGDLGQRMARVFRSLPPGPAVIIGSDIPDIGPTQIVQAFQTLGRHDAVFGPAEDGGYWLVGLSRRRALPRGFLDGVRWSSLHALADTLASLPRGFSVGFLETLADIDDARDYARWRARLNRPASSDAPGGAA